MSDIQALASSVGGIVLLVIIALLALFLHFLPSIVAAFRRHQNFAAILVLNLLLGWTLIGWVVALVWAFTAVDPVRWKETATTRKVILAIVSIVSVLVLIVALFVGGLSFFVFRTIGNSEAADTARTYLRNNETLKQEIGEVKDFGWLVSGNINLSNGDGVATLYLKAIGENGDAETRVDLQYRDNRAWRVTGASYTRNGKTIDLMQAYGPPSANSP